MKDKQTIIVVESVYRKARLVFDKADDLSVIIGPAEEVLLAELAQKENAFAVVLGTEKYSDALYKSLPQGGVLARFGVGCDGLDFQLAKEHQLHVTITAGVLDQTVAEFTVFMAGELLRKVGAGSSAVKQGSWSPSLGSDLAGKTWTILGMGAIGKKLSRILSFGFGVRVVGLDLPGANVEHLQKEYGFAEVFDDYSKAVSDADIVSVHLPVVTKTLHFINENRLAQMKPGALLINTARGSLVDESALFHALNNGGLAGAALDVFEVEPYIPQNPKEDLRTLANTVLTPHIASSSAECSARMAESVLHNIRMASAGRTSEMNFYKS